MNSSVQGIPHSRIPIRPPPEVDPRIAVATHIFGAILGLMKFVVPDLPDWNHVIDRQPLGEPRGRAGAPRVIEEPDDVAELLVIQVIGDPLLINQISDVTIPGQTSLRERWAALPGVAGTRNCKAATDDPDLGADPRRRQLTSKRHFALPLKGEGRQVQTMTIGGRLGNSLHKHGGHSAGLLFSDNCILARLSSGFR
jgi:hypothetical protein